MYEYNNNTVIEQGKIKWKLFDSKGNQYNWELAIQTYESYIQNTTHRTQTIQYSDGTQQEIGEFTDFVVDSFRNVIDEIYENSYNDDDFIYEIWYIISQLTTYSPDIGEHPRYALETLTRGGGDCEDTTILMADMLKSSKHTTDWNIQMVYFDSENPTFPKLVNHVALVVNTGEMFAILETTAKDVVDLITWDIDSIVGWWSDV
jgi:hypothetical protein